MPCKNAALGLHPGEVRVDGGAAVHAGVKFQQLYFAGLGVHFHLGRAHHVGRRRQGRHMGLGDFQRDVVAEHGSRGNITQRDRFRRVSRGKYRFTVKFHVVFAAVQQLCAQLADLAPQLQRTLLDGFAGDVGGAGRVEPES